jgi:streptomycin 6-kinase
VTMSGRPPIVVPESLAAVQTRYNGEAGRAWIAALPGVAESYLDQWGLTLDGPPRSGMAAMVLPVRRSDGSPAVLKLQRRDDESEGEATALRIWDGAGAVRLLREDPDTATLLLERLEGDRSLATIPNDLVALDILTAILARLVVHPAPPGMRLLRDIATDMVRQTPDAVERVPDPERRRVLTLCAAVVAELVAEPGDRLLHWDLHYENVLAGEREHWLAIDPKPLAGDPGFDLLPALWNRWDDVLATGDVPRAVRRRFDLMVDGLGLDRARAVGWSLGRVLQNGLWNVEDGETAIDEPQLAIVAALLERDGRRL